jgi:hypothetical protein
MQLLAQRPADSRIVVRPFRQPKRQSLAELRCRCFVDQVIFFIPLRGGSPGLIYDQLRKSTEVLVHANRRALIGMNQNLDVKLTSQRFTSQRSLFARIVHKPLELPIDKQHELQIAIAELLLNALTEDTVKEANIDDDEQQTYA